VSLGPTPPSSLLLGRLAVSLTFCSRFHCPSRLHTLVGYKITAERPWLRWRGETTVGLISLSSSSSSCFSILCLSCSFILHPPLLCLLLSLDPAPSCGQDFLTSGLGNSAIFPTIYIYTYIYPARHKHLELALLIEQDTRYQQAEVMAAHNVRYALPIID
jgi:hypothetical protein